MIFLRVLLFTAIAWSALASFTVSSCLAKPIQTSGQSASQEKALKYHAALQRRPNPGYLFDRFYNTWLDTSSLDQLEKFLASQVEKTRSTQDRLLLAFFHTKQGDDVRALEQFRLALANDPTSVETLYEKAVIEARTLDFDTAIADLTTAAAANPKDEVAIKIAQLQGKLLVRNRQNEEAIKVWQELVSKNAKDESLMEDIIELQISEGLYDEANALSDKLIKATKDPYQKVVRSLRKGDIFQRAGKRDKAIKVYGDALEQVGMDSWLEREILGQIEQLFRREDDVVGLKEHYDAMIKTDGKRMAIRKAASKVLMELGMVDEAIAAFEQVVTLTPGNRVNREALVSLLSRAGRLNAAIKQTESLIGQFPKDAELRINLAELQHRNGSSGGASEAVDQFLEAADNSEYAYLRAARLLEKFENVKKATTIYESCVSEFPDSDSAKETYAAFLYKLEKKDEALAIWKRLAAAGDRSQLVRVARIVSSRQEHGPAFDMLVERFEEFHLDSIYLGQLCTEAIAEKKFQEALPWALMRVKLAKSASDLEATLPQAIQIVMQTEAPQQTVERLKENPNPSTPLTCLLAELLERSNQSTAADELLKASLASARAKPQSDVSSQSDVQMLSRQLVRSYVSRQDWAAAAKAVEALVSLPGGRKSVNIRELVTFNIRADKLDLALKWIGEWKKVSPGSLLPWLNESKVYDRMGKFDEAINVLRMAAQQFPKDPDLFARLGERYVRNGQYPEAERIYWQRYEDSEKLSDKLQWSERLASLKEDTGGLDELIEKFEERRKSNPKSVEPLLALAQVHRVADNYEERRQALLQATRLQTESLPLLMEIARMEEAEGDWEKSIQTLEQASKLDKTQKAQQQIARLYIQYGEQEEGFARLLDIAGGSNASAREIESIADAIVSTEDWEQVRDFLAPKIARFADDYRLKFQLAIAYEELNELDNAEAAFLELLRPQAEVTGLKQPTNRGSMMNMMAEQLSMIGSVMPPAAAKVLEVSLYQSSAYGYRQQGRFAGFSPGTGFMPVDVESCQKLALCHLIGISSSLEPDKFENLKRKLKSAGVANAEILFEQVISPYGGASSDVSDLIEKFPDNDTALALSVFLSVDDESGDAELGVKAFGVFKEDYPVLAFLGAMQAAARDKTHAGLLDEAIGLVEKMETPNMTLIAASARYMGGSFGGQIDHELTPDHLSRLSGYLLESYPKIQGQSSMSPYMFMFVANALKQDKSPDRFVEFLDEEIVRRQGKKKSVNSMFGYPRMMGRETMMALPVFPPSQLITFPEDVLELLALRPDGDQFSPFSSGSGDPVEWAERFKEAPAKAKDPVLRALLQIKVALADPAESSKPVDQQYLAVKTTVAELLKSKRPNADAIYLAACLAAEEQRWTDSADHLEKMRSLPLSRQMRQTVDGNLVALATMGAVTEIKSKALEPVLKSAQSAALRLRRIRLTQQQRNELLTVFETLELKDEAAKMEEKIASSGGLLSRLFGGGQRSMSPAPSGRVDDLADSGKSDAAARLMVQEFRGLARPALSIDSIAERRYEMDEFESRLKTLGLKEEFLKQLEPGESTSATKIAAYALAEEFFNDKETAKKLYRQLLKSNDKQDGVRMRLMLLEMPTDPQAFRTSIVKFQKRNRPIVGSVAVQALRSADIDLQEVLGLAQQVLAYLENLEDDSEDGLDFVSSLVSWIASPQSVNLERETYVESLYQIATNSKSDPGKSKTEEQAKKSKRQLEQEQKLKSIIEKRLEIHDKLARKMTEYPEIAAAGFTALLASHEARGLEIGDEFVALATVALKPQPKKTGIRNQRMLYANSMYGYGYGYGSDDQNVTRRSPIDFLSRYYGLLPTSSDSKIEDLVSKLTASKDKEQAQNLKQWYYLYRSEPTQFSERAQALLDNAEKLKRRDPTAPLLLISKVIEIWVDREMPCDLEPLVISFLKSQKTGSQPGSGYSDNRYLSKFALALASKSDSDLTNVKAFFAKYRNELLGTEEEQAELAKLLLDPKSRSRNSKKFQSIFQYANLLRTIAEERDLVFFALEEGTRFNVVDRMGFSSYELQRFFSEYEAEEAEELLQWLGTTTVLKSLDEFDPLYNRSRNSDEPTFWAEVINTMSFSFDVDLGKSVVAILDKKGKLTFGEDLLKHAIQRKLGTTNQVMDFFADNLEAVKALPVEKQADICRFANQLANNSNYSYGGTPAPLSEKGLRAKKFIKLALGESSKGDIEKLVNAKRLSDTGLDEYRILEWSTTVMSNMDRSDPEKIIDNLVKVNKWVSRSGSQNYWGGNQSTSARMLAMLIEKDMDLETFGFVLALLSNEEAKMFNLTNELVDSLAGHVEDELNRERATIAKQSGKTPAEVPLVMCVDGFIRNQGAILGDANASALIPIYQNACLKLEADSEDLEKLAQWANSESKSGRHKQLAKAWQFAAQSAVPVVIANKKAGENAAIDQPEPKMVRLAELTPHQTKLLALIEDESQTLNCRIPIAAMLLQYDRSLPAAGVWKCVSMVGTAMSQKISIDDETVNAAVASIIDCEGHEEFQSNASAFGNIWKSQKLSTRQSNSYRGRDDGLVNVIKLFAKTKQPTVISQILRRYGESAQNISVVAVLLEHKLYQQASPICLAMWKDRDRLELDLQSLDTRYTKSLHDSLPELYELFKDEPTKLLAEVYFASLKDSKDKAKSFEIDRESRLAKIAERYPSVSFTSRSQQDLVLVLLAKSAAAAPLIAADLKERAAKIKVSDLWDQNGRGDYSRLNNLFSSYLAVQLRLGNVEPLKKAFVELNEEDPEQEFYFERVIQSIEQSVNPVLVDIVLQSDQKKLNEWLPLLSELGNPASKIQIGAELNLLAHVKAGKTAALLKQYEVAKQAGGEENQRSSGDMDELWEKVTDFVEQGPAGQDASKRMIFLKDLWQLGSTADFEIGSGHFQDGIQESCSGCRTGKFGLQAIVAAELLTTEEVAVHGASFAEIESVDGEIWRQVAIAQVKQKLFEQAAESYKKSLEASKPELKQAKYNRSVEYADVLTKLSRDEEAKQLLEGIEVDQLLGDNIQTHAQLKAKFDPK